MSIELSITPHGRPHVEAVAVAATGAGASPIGQNVSKRIIEAFAQGTPHGLLDLATKELRTTLLPGLAFARDFARTYFTQLCQTPAFGEGAEVPRLPVPSIEELKAVAQGAPPLKGAEYLTAEALTEWWVELDAVVRAEIRATEGGAVAWLREKSPVWRLVGRVTFHLAENKKDPEYPFAFLATYAGKLSSQAKVLHQPLGRALEEYSGAGNRGALLSLLTPVRQAAERSELVREIVDSGDVYHPLAWTPRDAYRFLRDVPVMEECGLIVRVPDWWKSHRPPRPVVNVQVEGREKSKLGAEALLQFSVDVSLEGQTLSETEVQSLLEANGSGLVLLKGKWVEVDRDKLKEALSHWKKIARDAKEGGVSFFEGMRLLSGAALEGDVATRTPDAVKEWVGISAADSLEETLRRLRDPDAMGDSTPSDLIGELRPYQQTGVSWLRFLSTLGLGACLADDMGLGKTVQVIALLLHMKRESAGDPKIAPSLLVVPASLIANWKAEILRFAPSLSIMIAHGSERSDAKINDEKVDLKGIDLVITTYGMIGRTEWLRERTWRLAILDEAQAIKNSGTRQTRAVKEVRAGGRIALTGTPVENRLSDLWSLFDFLNPGLLGSAKAFGSFAKQLAEREHNPYGPLRNLVRPYILRRMKTDKRIIADLPDKTEVTAYCGLTKTQAALYEQAVRELSGALNNADGIQRRGIVLAMLMRLKQICNHPAQLAAGSQEYDPKQSGKFERLGEICEELAERQEKVLVFTQFREITAPLAEYLTGVYGREGLVLHGQTPVGKRRQLVESFQSEEGPPFFVLSLRAGGTGLNLTEASHVIHFDRWWNPAVENQATDRAFRIGQKRNVLVHKFVCRGTVEEKIDAMIAEKVGLAKDLLEGTGESLLTEMSNSELLRMVSLDVESALG